MAGLVEWVIVNSSENPSGYKGSCKSSMLQVINWNLMDSNARQAKCRQVYRVDDSKMGLLRGVQSGWRQAGKQSEQIASVETGCWEEVTRRLDAKYDRTTARVAGSWGVVAGISTGGRCADWCGNQVMTGSRKHQRQRGNFYCHVKVITLTLDHCIQELQFAMTVWQWATFYNTRSLKLDKLKCI